MVEVLIRENKRAKRLILRVCPDRGAILTCPPRTPQKVRNTFIANHSTWIETQLEKQRTHHFPERMDLKAIRRNFQIEYQQSIEHGLRLIERPDGSLVIYGSEFTRENVQTTLKQWQRKQAQIHFTPWIRRLSKSLNLPFNDLTIRSQKTVWGSCAGNNDISLNDRLLFFPPEVVQYVMIHELCHTIYHNHSANFWNLVKKHDPQFRHHISQLKRQCHAK